MSGESHSTRGLLCNAGAGAAAGVIAATFVCPLDVIKTRLQVHGLPKLTKSCGKGSVIIGSLEQIVQKEGLRDGCKQLSVAANMAAASGAGVATTIVTNPLWVVKTRFQTQGLKVGVVPYKNTLGALRRITHEEGIRGLYSGLLPALAGISHVAIQFPLYEKIKHSLAKKDNVTVDSLGAGDVAIASSVSKILASTMTYPHEVVRSRLQEQGFHTQMRYVGVRDCIMQVFRSEGIIGFYRGCAINLLRTTPAAVITFTSFEMIHRFLIGIFPPDPQTQML